MPRGCLKRRLCLRKQSKRERGRENPAAALEKAAVGALERALVLKKLSKNEMYG